MTMDIAQFEEHLLVHGADVHRWPDDIRRPGLEALERSEECRSLRDDYLHYEMVLKDRRYEGPSVDLADRIISAASRRKQSTVLSLGEILTKCFVEFRLPQPVVTAAAVLMIGFVIGFMLPERLDLDASGQTDLQEFLYAAVEVP